MDNNVLNNSQGAAHLPLHIKMSTTFRLSRVIKASLARNPHFQSLLNRNQNPLPR